MRWGEGPRAVRLTRRVHSGALRAVDLLRRPLTWAGVDFRSFRAILSAKLLTDLRPRQGSQEGYGLVAAGLAVTMAMSFGFGLVISALLWLEAPPGEFVGSVQFGVLGMIAFPLLMDFDSVLADASDAAALEGQPVDERTLLAVRIVHATAYVALLAGPLVLPPLVCGCFVFPAWVFAPVLLVSSLLATALAVALVTGLFGIGLRLLGPKRFRGAVVGLQIGAVVAVLGSIQFAAVTGSASTAFELLERYPVLGLALPPLWFGGLTDVLLGTLTDYEVGPLPPHVFMLAGAAVIVPPVALLIALRALGTSTLREAALRVSDAARPAKRYGAWCTKPGPERAGYAFAKRMTLRERGYRMGAWTATAAYLPLGLGSQWAGVMGDEVAGVTRLVLPVYILMAVAPTLLFHMRFSDDWEAQWLLEGLTPRERAAFKTGAAKAVLYGAVLWLMPAFLVAPLAVHGVAALPQLLLAAGSVIAWNLAVAPLFLRRAPFSRKPSRAEAQGTTLGFLFVSVLLVLVALLHIGLSLQPVVLGVACATSVGAAIALHRWLEQRVPGRG